MRDAPDTRTKNYPKAPPPRRRDLLRLFDALKDGAGPDEFQVNNYILEKKEELESYHFKTVYQVKFSVLWSTPNGDAYVAVSYDTKRGGQCYITNHLHRPSLAVLALAEDIFTRDPSQNDDDAPLRSYKPPLNLVSVQVSSAPPPTVAVPATLPPVGFLKRVRDEMVKHAMITAFSVLGTVIGAALLAYFGLSH